MIVVSLLLQLPTSLQLVSWNHISNLPSYISSSFITHYK